MKVLFSTNQPQKTIDIAQVDADEHIVIAVSSINNRLYIISRDSYNKGNFKLKSLNSKSFTNGDCITKYDCSGLLLMLTELNNANFIIHCFNDILKAAKFIVSFEEKGM